MKGTEVARRLTSDLARGVNCQERQTSTSGVCACLVTSSRRFQTCSAVLTTNGAGILPKVCSKGRGSPQTEGRNIGLRARRRSCSVLSDARSSGLDRIQFPKGFSRPTDTNAFKCHTRASASRSRGGLTSSLTLTLASFSRFVLSCTHLSTRPSGLTHRSTYTFQLVSTIAHVPYAPTILQMFTPPPSPLPPPEPSSGLSAPAVSQELSPNAALKHKTTSRIRWSILAVPLVLVLITLTTRYISHPVLLDSFSALPHEPPDNPRFDDWGLHKRHPSPQHPVVPHAVRANTSPTPSVTAVPTIPVNPPLPTPFPQPFDTTLSKNFSTQACIDFYTNMTQSLPFRRCRPFGLLAEYSSQFIEVSA